MKYTIIILLFFCFGVCKGQEMGVGFLKNHKADTAWYDLGGIGNLDITINNPSDTPSGRLFDTVLVICQYSDTTAYKMSGYLFLESNIAKKDTITNTYRYEVYWAYLYSVREKHNTSEGNFDPGMTPWAWHDYWQHLYYLDDKKQPLPKNIIVWQAIGLGGD